MNALQRTPHAKVRFVSAFAATLLAIGLGSCGGGDNGGITNPPVVVASVSVSASTTTLAPPQILQLAVVAKTAAGAVVSSPSLSFTSSANGVATVNGLGVVTAVAPGSVTITATSGTVSGQVSLIVVAAGGTVASVSVRLSDATVEIGGLVQAIVSARDANNQVVAVGTRPLAWTSTNTSIATVSSDGIVSAVGVGTTQLRATVTEGTTNVSATAALVVTSIPGAPLTADVTMPGLTYSPADVVVKVGGIVHFIFPTLEHNVIWRPVIAGSPSDILITTNRTVNLTFPTSGVFPFVCTLHAGMKGTVVVSP